MKKREQSKRAKGTARTRGWLLPAAVTLFFFLTVTDNLFADGAWDQQDQVFARRAQTAYDKAKSQYEAEMNNPAKASEFARACYDWADWATNKSQRALIAREGIAACHQSLLFTNSAAAHYYLAMDMGQLAQSEMLGGLKLVHEMEDEFQAAGELDAGFDFAGSERGLGLLYRDAPGWPMSIGSRSKAREYLEKAAALAPGDPENILNLAESYLKWDKRAEAKSEMKALDALWPKAQRNFTGEAWQESWEDWSKRREAMREKLDQ